MLKQIPQFLQEKLLSQYGEELTNKIIEGYGQKRKVTFRVNTLKSNVNAVIEELTKQGLNYAQVSWNKDAFIVEDSTKEQVAIREQAKQENQTDIARQIRELAIYQNGEIYLQSLSSMLPAIILEPNANENILDMAAAPRRKNHTNSSNIRKCQFHYSL